MSKDEYTLREQIDNAVLLFAKQLRAVDYNRVKKLVTVEKEAIDRAEFHEYCVKDILKAIQSHDQAKRQELLEALPNKDYAITWTTDGSDGRYETQFQKGYNQVLNEVTDSINNVYKEK